MTHGITFMMTVLAVFGAGIGAADSPKKPHKRAAESGPIVFVCEHGAVKSVIAAEWFNRLAAERGVAVRAVSRGLAPDPSVPGPIAEKLRGDGFDVRGFRPRALASSDVAGASRLVMIGAEPPAWASSDRVAQEKWDGIPPTSQSYEACRDALRERVITLLDALLTEKEKPR